MSEAEPPPQGRAHRTTWSDARQFVTFLVVGVLNTLFGYSVFLALLWFSSSYVVAAVGATILGALFNFKSIGTIVFASSALGLLPRFLTVYAGQCAANIGLLRLAEGGGVSPILAEAFILPALAVASYLAMKAWVFGGARQPSNAVREDR